MTEELNLIELVTVEQLLDGIDLKYDIDLGELRNKVHSMLLDQFEIECKKSYEIGQKRESNNCT